MSPVKKFNPGRIQGAAAEIAGANRAIIDSLEALDREVRTLRSHWNGAASDAYDIAQAQWGTQLSEMNRILAAASAAATNAGERYSSGRSKIERRWG